MCDNSYVTQPLGQIYNFIKPFYDEVAIFNPKDSVIVDDNSDDNVGEASTLQQIERIIIWASFGIK